MVDPNKGETMRRIMVAVAALAIPMSGGNRGDRGSFRNSRGVVSGDMCQSLRFAHGNRSLQGVQHSVCEGECGGHLACHRWNHQLGGQASGFGLAFGFRRQSRPGDLRNWLEGVRRFRDGHRCHWKRSFGDQGGGWWLREVLCHEDRPPRIGQGQRLQGLMESGPGTRTTVGYGPVRRRSLDDARRPSVRGGFHRRVPGT